MTQVSTGPGIDLFTHKKFLITNGGLGRIVDGRVIWVVSVLLPTVPRYLAVMDIMTMQAEAPFMWLLELRLSCIV